MLHSKMDFSSVLMTQIKFQFCFWCTEMYSQHRYCLFINPINSTNAFWMEKWNTFTCWRTDLIIVGVYIFSNCTVYIYKRMYIFPHIHWITRDELLMGIPSSLFTPFFWTPEGRLCPHKSAPANRGHTKLWGKVNISEWGQAAKFS